MLEQLGAGFVRKQREHRLALAIVEAVVEVGLVRRMHGTQELCRGFDVVAAEERFDAVCRVSAFGWFSRHDHELPSSNFP